MIGEFENITFQLWSSTQKKGRYKVDPEDPKKKREIFIYNEKYLFPMLATTTDDLIRLKNDYKNIYPNGQVASFFCDRHVLKPIDVPVTASIYEMFNKKTSKLFEPFQSSYSRDPYNVRTDVNELFDEFIGNTHLLALNNYRDFKSNISRLFVIYVNPALRKKLIDNPMFNLPVSIFFHPYGGGEISSEANNYFDKNGYVAEYYLDLARRYMFSPQGLAFHHLLARKKNKLSSDYESMPWIVIFPILSGKAYTSFPNFIHGGLEISFFELLKTAINKVLKLNGRCNIGHISVSGYSQGCSLVNKAYEEALKDIKNKKFNTGTELIHALYFFDPPSNFKFNSASIKTWMSSMEFKKKVYKIYTANPQIVNFKEEIKDVKTCIVQSRDHYIKANFEKFNGTLKSSRDIVSIKNNKYKGLINPYELYSQDDKRYFFVFHRSNFQDYFYGVANPSGINLGNGHFWFYGYFLSHALANTEIG